MKRALAAQERSESKDRYIKGAVSYSITEGAGKNYVIPYALSLGASNLQVGFLSSVPVLMGSIIQLFTVRAMENHARKKITVIGAGLETLAWIPIIAIGLLFHLANFSYAAITLIIVYSLLWVFSYSYVPALGSLLKDIVLRDRGKYFAKKDRYKAIVGLISMLSAGMVLDYYGDVIGFTIILVLAFVGSLGLFYNFSRIKEPKIKLKKGYYFTFWQFVKYVPRSNFGKFAVFIALMKFAFFFAFPFFTVYMLKALEFSYMMWIIVMIAEVVVMFLSLSFWGQFSDTYGNIKTVKITGALYPVIPFLWLLSPSAKSFIFPYLILASALSGFARAGFNLAASNFIYDAVTNQRMDLCVAYSNLFNAAGIFAGGILGGLVASLSFNPFGFVPILAVFLFSAVLGLMFYLVMANLVKEVREVPKFGIQEAREKLLAVTQRQTFKLRW